MANSEIIVEALATVTAILPKAGLGSWNHGQESHAWQKCFSLLSSMPGNTQKLLSVARETHPAHLLDTLAEIKYAVTFTLLGFQVEFEPQLTRSSSVVRPDMKISRDNLSTVLDVKRFRPPGFYSPGSRLLKAPDEITADYVFPEFGEPSKDLQKIFNEIEKKFRQSGTYGIVAFWNNNDELFPVEFATAAERHKLGSGSERNAAFLICRCDPFEKLLCYKLKNSIHPILEKWMLELGQTSPDDLLMRFVNSG